MRLLYCDESNFEERAGDFLIYGGLVIDAIHTKNLSAAIDDIRAEAGVDRAFRLKFNPGPPNFSNQQFIQLKEAVIQAAISHGVKLLIYVVLHDIASNPDLARRNGINTICFHFDCVLSIEKDAGLVLIDRFNDKGNAIEGHLTEKFSIGIKGLPFTPERRLSNIVGFHYSSIGQSHFPSIVDIVLGSFRFAINAHTRGAKENLETAKTLMSLLNPFFFSFQQSGAVSEVSLFFSPKTIKVEKYRDVYKGLKAFLADGGVNCEQEIEAPS